MELERNLKLIHFKQTENLEKRIFTFFHNIMKSGNWQANQILYRMTTWKSQINY